MQEGTATRRHRAGEEDQELRILHVDMDAFFVAVEVQADPSLAGRPVIVGGAGRRGVVASCSYEARAYGIHSAMPSARARSLCPEAVFLAGRYDAYAAVSRRLHAVLGSFTPAVEGIALDEAFLDVGGSRRLFGPAPAMAHTIRRAVRDALALDCSVGVARSKLLAKLASKAAKPKATRAETVPGPGVVVVSRAEELAFLHPLPVSALWGVGPATAARLARLGVDRVEHLAAVPLESLVATFGRALGRQLHDIAWARDERRVEPDRGVKSIGHEETYAADHADPAFLQHQVVRMADAVASRVRAAGMAGRTVTVKVRFGDFTTLTRSHTAAVALADGPGIARVAAGLLAGVDVRPGVRLLGVSLSGLAGLEEAGAARQLSFDDPGQEPGWGAASAAVDAVRARFGERAVGPAALAQPGGAGLDVKRVGDTQWGPSALGSGRDETAPGPG
ncbi:MAG: DNA polymerase IV [Acidimicrobiales bacterium]